MLELKNLTVLQHAWIELSRTFGDFLHRELNFARLQMRNEDFRSALKLFKLLGEQTRTQILGDLGQLPLTIVERRFDDEIFQIHERIDDWPQRVVGGRVAGKHETCLPTIQQIADGRYHVIGRQCGDSSTAAERDGLAKLDRLELQKRLFGCRYLRKVRPDRPIEDVIAENLDRRGQRMQHERARTHRPNGVDHQWNRADMIEVTMRHKT